MLKGDTLGEVIFYFMCDIFTKERSKPLEDRLYNFLGSHKIHLSNDTDIMSICKKLNLTGLYMPLDDSMDGFILVNKKYRVIAIKESLEPLDARFLIAHELAHYITKYSESKDDNSQILIAARETLRHGENKSAIEHDMDYLAAAILVPQEQFKRELDAIKIKYDQLHTEADVVKNIPIQIISEFATRYRVHKQLIIRRIAEVSYYA